MINRFSKLDSTQYLAENSEKLTKDIAPLIKDV